MAEQRHGGISYGCVLERQRFSQVRAARLAQEREQMALLEKEMAFDVILEIREQRAQEIAEPGERRIPGGTRRADRLCHPREQIERRRMLLMQRLQRLPA